MIIVISCLFKNEQIRLWSVAQNKAEKAATNRWCGTRMLLMPPSLTLILRHRLESVWGEVFTTFFTWTHWVAIPRRVSPTRFTSAAQIKRVFISLRAFGSVCVCVCAALTVDGGFSGQDDDDELQSGVGVLQVSEHGLHAVGSLCVLTETRLTLDRHPSVLGDLTQLVRETPVRRNVNRVECTALLIKPKPKSVIIKSQRLRFNS